ncbi:hypothetical protein ACT8ZV_02450 [Nocardioides sp. MAHUQ-72]|uniref:hypothetical protein n=1 Tax=unclassified Nocardioides TaxID=2615069 RepID=UPI003615795B
MPARRRPSPLVLGSATSGLLAYVFFALVTHALGSRAAAPVSVLWSWWSFAGAALTFPVQHWVARTVAARGGEAAVRRSLPALARATVLLALVVTVVAWLARARLFHDDGVAFALLAGLVTLGAGLTGLVRGVLSARHRFGAVAAALVAENLVRALAAAVLLAAGVTDPVAYGLCLIAGYVVNAWWPSALHPRRTGEPAGADGLLASVGGTGAAQLVAQAVLTGSPVVLAAAGGAPAEVTALFAGLALFRAPYTLLLGAVAPLTGRLTALATTGRAGELDRLRDRMLVAAVVSAAAAGALGWLLGPWSVRLVFGADVTLARATAVPVAVGSALAMANLLLTLLVIARGRVLHLLRSWLLALLPGAALLLVTGAGSTATAAAFAVVEAAALVLLAASDRYAARPAR